TPPENARHHRETGISQDWERRHLAGENVRKPEQKHASKMPALPVATGLLHPSRHLDNNRRVQPIHQPAKPSNFFRTIGRLLHFLAFTLAVVGSCGAAPPRTVRVLMWDEQQPEQKRA